MGLTYLYHKLFNKPIYCVYCKYDGLTKRGCFHPKNIERVKIKESDYVSCAEYKVKLIRDRREINANNDCSWYKLSPPAIGPVCGY